RIARDQREATRTRKTVDSDGVLERWLFGAYLRSHSRLHRCSENQASWPTELNDCPVHPSPLLGQHMAGAEVGGQANGEAAPYQQYPHLCSIYHYASHCAIA